MAALATDANPRRRLMVDLLARTGMRAGELAALTDEAMVHIGDTHWLRIPIGKLHNDRYVPSHPILVELITNYRATRPTPRSNRLVERDDGQPFERRTIHRYVTAVAKRAGVGPVHPHQLRHTFGNPSDQPRHEPRSNRRLARVSHDAHDPRLRPDLGPHRRRRYFRVTEAVEANYQNARPISSSCSCWPSHARIAV